MHHPVSELLFFFSLATHASKCNAGGTPIFALEQTPTRNQAVIMLVRLPGKEQEALSGTWALPFADVATGSTSI